MLSLRVVAGGAGHRRYIDTPAPSPVAVWLAGLLAEALGAGVLNPACRRLHSRENVLRRSIGFAVMGKSGHQPKRSRGGIQFSPACWSSSEHDAGFTSSGGEVMAREMAFGITPDSRDAVE